MRKYTQRLIYIFLPLIFFSMGCTKTSGFAPSELISLVSGSIQFTTLNGGEFGSGSAGAIIEKSIEISTVDGVLLSQVTATVPLPFRFKGGAYPGVGGTCGATISGNCTIVVNFEPTSSGAFSNYLTFNYQVSGVPLSSNLYVAGSATLPPPTELSWSGSNSIQSNQCTPFVIYSVITGNIPSAVSANTTVNLAINSGTGTYYSDISCSSSITSTQILAGQNSQTVYFRSVTAPQTPTLVATSSGYSSGTKVITIASVPTQLSLTVPAQSVVNDCRLVTVARLDTNGLEVASLSTTNINLSQNGNLLFYSNAACSALITTISITSGSSSSQFYVSNTNIESVTVTAADAAASLTLDTAQINFVSNLQWWNTSFTKRIQVTIDNKDQSTTFSNQAVLVRLHSSITPYSNFKSDGSDLRFVAADHATVMAHEIEKWDVNGYSYVWVKVPTLSADSDMTIFMYFGNPSASSAEDPSSTWSRYSSVWHLKESPSSAAPQFSDLGTAAQHGTASNSPASTTGIIGEALDLNGTLDSIDVGNLAPTLGTTATLSFWINTSMTGHNTNYLAPGITGIEVSGGTNDIFWGWIDASGYIGVTAGDGVGAKSLLAINDNVWRHISITRNGANGAVAFYVNGVLNNSGTSGLGNITTAFSKFGVIPRSNGSTPTDFNGKIDEIRIQTSVLNSEQIKADFKFQNNSQLGFGQLEEY